VKTIFLKIRYLFLIPFIALLTACGGGSSDNDGTVSLLITDNLAVDYSEIWVNLQSVTVNDNNGQTATLYQDTTGQTHNLSQLANIGALVDAQTVPAGTYTSFDIVLANSIDLVDQAGVVTTAKFDQTSGSQTFSLTVAGSLTVDANQTTTLALDFDLAQFSYDAGTNTVTPMVVQKDPAALNQTVSTIYGEVERVINSSQFVLDPTGNGRHLTVVLHNSATVTNTSTNPAMVTADTSGLTTNMYVSVSGTYDAAALTITAISVQTGNNATNLSHKMEGTIVSASGGTLSVDVREANFMPGANSLSINVSNAIFSHGALTDLAAGQKIEIKGSWDGTIFTPVVVEIEGYSSNRSDDSHSYNDDYAEIKGQITAVNSNQLSLTVQEREHVSGIDIGDSVTIDSSNSWIEHGNSSCLVVDAVIEAKGPMTDATTMAANKIEIKTGCSQ